MGNTGSTRSGAKALASAAAAGDVDGAREIITASPAAWLNTFGVRNALIAAAEQGNANLLKLICESGGGQIRQSINAGASKGQAPLMRACMYGSPQHVECVAYLLVHGADVYVQTSRGDNALHIAAKHGNAGGLHALLSARPQADGDGGTVLLGDVIVQGDTGPTKLIDLHNGSGLTALHLAAIKGSVAVVRALVRAGASLDALTLSGVLNPNLSRGSTALHIAAARGHAACVSALMESQAAIPGMELQRIRNARGLKPSQLARLAGHHSVARLLSEAHVAPAQSGGHAFADTHRRSRRSAHARADQLQQQHSQPQQQQQHSRSGSGPPERPQVSQEAVIGAIVQRAKLLLSLRAVSQQMEPGCHSSADASSEEAALVAVAAEVTEALRSKGPGGQHSESLSTLLGLLASLTDSSSPVAQQYMSASGPSAITTDIHHATASNSSSHADAPAQDTHSQPQGASAATMEPVNASGAPEQKRKSDGSDERPQQRAAKAYAAGALVQAALNAMAAGVQGPQPLTFLTPTSSAAAAIAVQAALKKLSSSRHGARTLASAGLPDQAATSGSLHRQASTMSVRSVRTVASVGASSTRSGRRHRRQHALRQTLSGTLTRHGSASEMLSAMTAGHTPAASVSRRRRHSHRRSGSSGSVSALILSPVAPRTAAAPGAGSHLSPRTTAQAAAAEASVAAEHGPPNAPHTPGAQEVPAFQWDATGGRPGEERGGDIRRHAAMAASNSAAAAYGLSETGESLSEPSEAGTWLASPSPAAGPAQLHLLPFQIYKESALVDNCSSQPQLQDFRHSVPDGPSQATSDLSTDQIREPAPQPCNTGSDLSGASTSAVPSPDSPAPGTGIPTRPGPFPGHDERGLALGSTAAAEPPSQDQNDSYAAHTVAQASPQNAAMAQLQVRSRLFSISDDVPDRVSPYGVTGSPTDPFESAELLGSDSLPSSPFGESRAGDALLQSSDNNLSLISSGAEAAHSSPDTLFMRGRFMQTSDVAELLQTACSGNTEPASHGPWGGHAYGRGRWSSHGQESILESGDIEALLGDDDTTTAFATLNMEHLAPWSAAAGEPRDYLPSDSAEPEHSPEPVLGDHQLERGAAGARMPAPPLPGTAAAQVAQAFGRRLTFQSAAQGTAERQAGPPSSLPRTLPSTDLEEADLQATSRQASLAPPPGAAAAAVARAFAKMSTAERSPPQPHVLPSQPGGGHAPSATAVRSATVAADEPSRAAASGHAGYCALQREDSVPPTPGVAAAQVASAFARLRSRSNSPRDSDADAHKSDENSYAAQHLDRAPCQAFHMGACSAEATCGASDAASQGSSQAQERPRRAFMAGRHDCWEHQAGALQEAPESSGAGFAASRSENGGDGQACAGARGSATGELDAAAGGEAKAPGRHGKGKERAGSSAKAWTEMCAICMDAGLEISIGGCGHSLCSRCAYQLCARGLAAPVCPFCRGVIQQFEPMLTA
ncbi:probable E3 ubiquitin-protein ligase XBOS32 at N-terminal half [Coccomyxa sp. Obi]|nr:probable E3 ubiquitin-protein ligase XBOS32 at N-terminal half [Coccomyxa sp. Obi]